MDRSQISPEKKKMQPAHPKRQTGKKNETEWYLIDGKWLIKKILQFR
jgi:hypothetical protein